MTILVNGEPRPLEPGLTVEALVAERVPAAVEDGRPRGVAVAIDDSVVPRGAWATTVLAAGDRVEILTAVQGG